MEENDQTFWEKLYGSKIFWEYTNISIEMDIKWI